MGDLKVACKAPPASGGMLMNPPINLESHTAPFAFTKAGLQFNLGPSTFTHYIRMHMQNAGRDKAKETNIRIYTWTHIYIYIYYFLLFIYVRKQDGRMDG